MHKDGSRELAMLKKGFAPFGYRSPSGDANRIRVLMWMPVGGAFENLGRELSLALALNARGCETVFGVCDGVMSGCVLRSLDDGKSVSQWKRTCANCAGRALEVLKQVGMPHFTMGEYVSSGELREFREMADQWARAPENKTYLDLDVSSFVLASALRYFKGKEKFVGRDAWRSVLREYFVSALVCARVADRLFGEGGFDRMVTSNVQHVEFGPMHDKAVMAGTPVTLVMDGFLPNHLYAAHGSLARGANLFDLDDEDWRRQTSRTLTQKQEQALNDYLRNISAQRSATLFSGAQQDRMRQKLKLNSGKPTWLLFSHVHWDMIFDKTHDLFDDIHDWVLKTVGRVAELDSINWVVRCHPGEVLDGTLMPTHEIIRQAHPRLPDHVKIVHGPDINTYALMANANGCVTIRSTAGIEMLIQGKPAILAGPSYYGRKGFTYDAESRDHYYRLLEQAAGMESLDEQRLHLVRVFAYHFLIERQIPYRLYDKSRCLFRANTPDELLPGRDRGLDVICDGILHGKPFEMREGE